MNARILDSVDVTKNSRIQWTTYGKSDITKFGIEYGIQFVSPKSLNSESSGIQLTIPGATEEYLTRDF